MFKRFGPKLILLVALALLLELKVMPFFSFQGVRPDLFFILLAFYSFFILPSKTVHFAVFLGIVRDLFSGSFFGLETISYGLSGLLLWLLVSKVERENLYNQGVLIFTASAFNFLVFSILSRIFCESSVPLLQIIFKVVGSSIYTCLLGPFLFEFIRRFLGLTERNLFESAHKGS